MNKVRIERNGPRVDIYLARPEVRNAFDAELIAELTEAFQTHGEDPELRVAVLRGDGPHFCAGADLEWMRSSIELSEEENKKDAARMARLFESIDGCPVPVVAAVHGAALGGGSGLTAAADVAIATEDSLFGFTEVRLGIMPAVISPFALGRIGTAQARRYFLTGERFDATVALRIGLVSEVVAVDELDDTVDKLVEHFLNSAPGAVREAKALIREISTLPDPASQRDLTTERIARRRTTEEAQEGMRAFLERRRATWRISEGDR